MVQIPNSIERSMVDTLGPSLPETAAIEAALAGAGDVEVDIAATIANVLQLQASLLGGLPGGSVPVAPVAAALRSGLAIGKCAPATFWNPRNQTDKFILCGRPNAKQSRSSKSGRLPNPAPPYNFRCPRVRVYMR